MCCHVSGERGREAGGGEQSERGIRGEGQGKERGGKGLFKVFIRGALGL